MAGRTLSILNRLARPAVSLVGAVSSVLIMFCIHWGFALATICAALLLYIYIGHVNSGLPPGQADFRLSAWVQGLYKQALPQLSSCSDVNKNIGRSHIVTEPQVPFDFSVQQQTEGCEDYDQRPLYHHEAQEPQGTFPLPMDACAPHVPQQLASTRNG